MSNLKPGRQLDALIAEKAYRCRACGNTEYKLMGGKRCCYKCHKKHGNNWRLSNPEKVAASHERNKDKFKVWRKKWALAKRYGLTSEDYEYMLKSQNGVCLICGGNQSRHRALVVDHCHVTGKVRGLLCDPCNIGLANFRENPISMIRAAEYIKTAPHAICLAALRAVSSEQAS